MKQQKWWDALQGYTFTGRDEDGNCIFEHPNPTPATSHYGCGDEECVPCYGQPSRVLVDPWTDVILCDLTDDEIDFNEGFNSYHE